MYIKTLRGITRKKLQIEMAKIPIEEIERTAKRQLINPKKGKKAIKKRGTKYKTNNMISDLNLLCL